MNKVLFFVFIMVFVVISFELGYLYFNKYKLLDTEQSLINNQSSNLTAVTPTPIEFKIISQKQGDVQGKSVIYQTSVKDAYNDTSGDNYIVGYFDKVIKINDSSDYYILIKDSENGISSISARLIIEPTLIADRSKPSKTFFGIENVNKTEKWGIPSQSLEGSIPLKEVFNKLNQYINTNDVVVITYMNNKQFNIIKDINNFAYASAVLVRRYNFGN